MRWLVSYVVVIASSVLSAILAGFLFHGLNKTSAIICLFIGLALAVFALIKYKNLSCNLKKEDFGFWSWVIILFFILFCLRSFLWLVFKRGDSLQVLCVNNLGDMPYHMNYIQYFASGASFWPTSPVLTGTKVHYHFGIDLFTSLLVLSGVDIIQSLRWVGIIGSAFVGFSLLMWGKAFTLAGFLFSGGLAGLEFFKDYQFADYQKLLDWKSVPLAMLVPQRPWLYAIPAGLLLLYNWKQKLFIKTENASSYLPLWIEVLVFSSLPIFQIHTFLFLSFLLLVWVLICNNEQKKEILKVIIYSIPLAVVFMYLLTDSFKKGSMVHLDLEYLKNLHNFQIFWIYNFGIFWPLVILLCYKFITNKTNEYKLNYHQFSIFAAPAIFLFIFFSVVIISAWKYDNAKLLLWSYLILLPFIWESLISKQDELVKLIVCFVLFFSGFVCTVSSLGKHHGYEIFKFSELYETRQAIRNIPIDSRFATFPTYNHPLLFYGRKIVLGYPGWLWAHGFNYIQHEQKLKRLMLGESSWKELASELDVRYIFWGTREEREYSSSLKPWETVAKRIYSSAYFQLYDLKNTI